MSKKQDQTASFMVRFNQNIFEEDGESKVQWRGKISHVQEGDEQNFTDFNDALVFMQQKLANLTKEATKHKTTEQQEGILQKSLYMWKTMKEVGPKVLMETIKDPKKQLSQFQDQIQEQISSIGGEISEKVQIDEWRNASRSDYKKVKKSIAELSQQIELLSEKIDNIGKKK